MFFVTEINFKSIYPSYTPYIDTAELDLMFDQRRQYFENHPLTGNRFRFLQIYSYSIHIFQLLLQFYQHQ